MRILLIILVALLISCGKSTGDKAKEEVAKSLGVDKEELDSKSYYTFTVQDGDLSGKTFATSSYAQTMNGFRYGGDSKIETLEITFIEPEQGNSTFKISFKNETAQPFGSEKGSEFKVSFSNDGKTHTLTSKSGTIKVNEFIDNKASSDDSRGSFADERKIELDFEGVFIDQTSNEEVKVNGKLQFVSNF